MSNKGKNIVIAILALVCILQLILSKNNSTVVDIEKFNNKSSYADTIDIYDYIRDDELDLKSLINEIVDYENEKSNKKCNEKMEEKEKEANYYEDSYLDLYCKTHKCQPIELTDGPSEQ